MKKRFTYCLRLLVLLALVGNINMTFATVTIYDGNKSFSNLTIAANDTIIIRKIVAEDGTVTANGDLSITGKLILNNNSYLVVGGNLELSSSGSITYNGGAISVRGDMTQSSGAKIAVSNGKTGELTVMGTFYDNANNNHPWNFEYHYEWYVIGTYYWYTFDVDNNFTFNTKAYQNTTISAGSGWGINNKATALKALLDDLKEHGNDYDEEVLKEKINEIKTLLPIELTSFTVSATEYGYTFNWVTASEVENDYFTLEFSENGEEFIAIDYVSGAGTTSETTEYEYVWDAKPTAEILYFRLKQTDYNGEFTYSDILVYAPKKSHGATRTLYYGPLKLNVVDGQLQYIVE